MYAKIDKTPFETKTHRIFFNFCDLMLIFDSFGALFNR